MFNRRLIAALVAAALLANAGCGSGSDGDATAKKASVATKSSYAAKADAICAEANKKEAAAGAPGPGWIYMRQFDDVRFLKRFNAPGREAVRKLRVLEPPPGKRGRANTMVRAIAQMVRAIDGRIADLKGGGGDASARIKSYLGGYSDLTPAAAVLGLSECQGVSL